MPALQIKVSGNRQVLEVIGEVIAGMQDLQPALELIGARMVERTKQRFDTLIGPDGQRWPANADTTLEQYLNRFANAYKKDGTLSKQGRMRAAFKRPLTGESGALRTTINYRLIDKNTVRIGSPMEYARVQQEGARRGQLGTGAYKTRKGTFPIPWGDIPARPFLGFPEQDQADIVGILRGWFKQAR